MSQRIVEVVCKQFYKINNILYTRVTMKYDTVIYDLYLIFSVVEKKKEN